MVQKTDVGYGTYYYIKYLCENTTVGGYNDWRLPTLDELRVLYQNKTKIGGFTTNYYWSTTNYYYDYTQYLVNFNNGYETNEYYLNQQNNYGRAVRTINGGSTNKDYVSFPEHNLMVQKADLTCSNYYYAENLCENSTVGGYNDWRIPTLSELYILYQNRAKIGGFVNDYYWSSTTASSSSSYATSKYFFSGSTSTTSNRTNLCRVRAVRSFTLN